MCAVKRSVTSAVSMTAAGSRSANHTTIRLPTWVEAPSLTAQHVAVLMPKSTSTASSSAGSGLSPNAAFQSAPIVTASSRCDDAQFLSLGLFANDTRYGH